MDTRYQTFRSRERARRAETRAIAWGLVAAFTGGLSVALAVTDATAGEPSMGAVACAGVAVVATIAGLWTGRE